MVSAGYSATVVAADEAIAATVSSVSVDVASTRIASNRSATGARRPSGSCDPLKSRSMSRSVLW